MVFNFDRGILLQVVDQYIIIRVRNELRVVDNKVFFQFGFIDYINCLFKVFEIFFKMVMQI